VAAAYLVKVHVQVTTGGAVLCDVNEVLSCSSAANSPFAKLLGIPIALLGVAWYVSALWLIARKASGLLAIGYVAGTVYSAFLLVVSIAFLGTLCPACAVLYACNAVGAVGAVVWARRTGGFESMTDMRSLTAGGAAAAITLAVVSLGVMLMPKPAAAPTADALNDAQMMQLNRETAPSIGAADAEITIVEFSDFQCPFCSRLANSMHELMELYPGEIRLVFRHYPLSFHEHAHLAAQAAVCAQEQGRFWEMHDAMFEHQASLHREGLIELAGDAGVDADALTACLDAGEIAATVDADHAAGEALGVTGTPKFFVNGVPYAGALPLEQLVAIIDTELGN
jgi:protein-disulfide isomerase